MTPPRHRQARPAPAGRAPAAARASFESGVALGLGGAELSADDFAALVASLAELRFDSL